MVHKFVLAVLLVCLSVEAYQLTNEDLIEKLLQEERDNGVSDKTFAKVFADLKLDNDEEEEEDESLDDLELNALDDDDDDDDDDGDDGDEDEKLDMINKLTYGSYDDESPQLMDDDDDIEEIDENAVEPKLKDPLWFRFPRFRFPRFRFPRFRFPRIRFPRIRFPRIRFPRIRLPRIRFPRIRLPRIRFPRIRFPRIRLPRIRLPRIRLPRIRLRLRNLLKPQELFQKLLMKLLKKKKKQPQPQNPCPYSEAQVLGRVNGMKCPAHWKTFFGEAKSTANEIVDGENFVNYCKPYTLCKACAPTSPWSATACENKLNNELQQFCKAISTDDADLLPWCNGIVSKIMSYERSQTHSNNADLCKCGAGEAGKP